MGCEDSDLRLPRPKWRTVRLGDIATKVGSGATPKGGASSYLPRRLHYALIRSQNVFDHYFEEEGLAYISDAQASQLKGAFVEPGDVLLNITGDGVTFGRSCLIPEHVLPACVNQHVMIIRLNQTLCLPEYFVSWLTLDQIKFYIESFNSGGSRRAITKGHVESFEVPLPPLSEQRKIAEIVSALNNRIDLLARTNATLEAIAQAIFKSWFIDFDPVHAKAVGQEPEGMDAETAALFPSELEESELGSIPKGWRVDEIGNVVTCVGGSTPSTKMTEFWEPEAHYWATPKDLSSLSAPVLLGTNRRISDAGLSKISSGLLPKGSLLLSSRAPVGYLAIASIPTAINQGFIAMHPGGTLPTLYLLFWTRLHLDDIKQRANGSTFMEISKAVFRSIKLVVPPAPIVTQFVGTAQPLLDKIANNERYRQTLTALRNTLLPRLISGKLRIPEAEELVEEALT